MLCLSQTFRILPSSPRLITVQTITAPSDSTKAPVTISTPPRLASQLSFELGNYTDDTLKNLDPVVIAKNLDDVLRALTPIITTRIRGSLFHTRTYWCHDTDLWFDTKDGSRLLCRFCRFCDDEAP